MADLPAGTVTFFFSDIEGSTTLVRETGEAFAELLGKHSEILRRAIDEGGGVEVRTDGDGFFVAFPSAVGAVTAAITAQRALAGHDWPPGSDLKVRMGMHTGNGVLGGDDYVGIDVHRAARIAASAHGGQVVVSEATARLVEHHLPDDVRLRDLGEHRLKDMPAPERILQLDIAGLPAEFPRLRTLDVPTNLPTGRTGFVGRRDELDQATTLLGGTRLLTLTGPGGAGKTRLAVEVAASATERFPDGVFFVGLEQVTEAQRIPGIVADAVGAPVATGQDQDERLRSHLGTQRVLLLLDNLEQVDDPASVVSSLLDACPNVTVLATSRIAVRVSGEQEMPVPTMSSPSADDDCEDPAVLMEHDSVALFQQRAAAVKPGFTITAENCAAVAALCGRLDGLPLAIEIAAARVKLLPPASIVERLGDVLGTAGSRDLPDRQRTLRNAIAWSHDLLDEPVRRVFHRLSVFAGGAGLDELEVVVGDDGSGLDPLEGISHLVDHSLLAQSAPAGEPRFQMLETIRDFARERLEESGDRPAVCRRHVEAYLALVERAHPELIGGDRDRWLARLERDRRNVEAALDWALEAGLAEEAQRLVASFWRFWQMRGHLAEALPTIDRAISLTGAASESRTRALEAAGGAAYWLGDLDRTRSYYEEALAYWREAGDDVEIAHALLNLSYPVGLGEGAEPAVALLEEALTRYEAAGHRLGMGRVNRMLGVLEGVRGDEQAWLEHGERSLEYFDPREEPFDYGWACFSVASASYVLEDFDRSGEALREGLDLFARVADVSASIPYLDGFVQLARTRGRTERAARLSGAVTRLREASGSVSSAVGPIAERWLDATVHEELAREHPAAFAVGRAWTLDEAVRYALEGGEQ